ncbi:MAG TPA: PGPGW domain-containing protein [Candidatus Saccharimonadales bacterium]|jgi:hypothetical protein
MERMKTTWQRVPRKPRRVLVFILGFLLIVLAGLIGWIPGPGGMVPFLLGIAVLATEFAWARRLQQIILDGVSDIGRQARRHPILTSLLIVFGVALIGYGIYQFFNHIL